MLDVGQFITPFPGPFRYSSPASVPNAMERPRLEEQQRSNQAQEQLQREQNQRISDVASANRSWERQKFVAEGVRKKAEEDRELQSKWLDKVITQDWAGANALAAEMRSRGIPLERVGPPPEAPQTPEGQAGTASPAPSAPAPKAGAGEKPRPPVEYDVEPG